MIRTGELVETDFCSHYTRSALSCDSAFPSSSLNSPARTRSAHSPQISRAYGFAQADTPQPGQMHFVFLAAFALRSQALDFYSDIAIIYI